MRSAFGVENTISIDHLGLINSTEKDGTSYRGSFESRGRQ